MKLSTLFHAMEHEIPPDLKDFEIPEFKPCVMYTKELDLLNVYLEDCSYTSHLIPKTSIAVMKNKDQEIVGIEIWGISKFLT